MKTVIIDNYDSFTYNLAHMVRAMGVQADVLRNDRFELQDLQDYDKIILSPGPGIPQEAGLMPEVIRIYAPLKPMLGVCLGHQAIAEAFGASLLNLAEVYHGVQSPLIMKDEGPAGQHDAGLPAVEDDYILHGLTEGTPVGRYHSWVVSTQAFPSCLAVTALSPEGHIMGLKHRQYDVHGIQFHPESVLTPEGRKIVENFLFNEE